MGYLRKATNFAAGISAGGGDTGFYRQPQETLLALNISGTAAQTVALPKGTIILDTVLIPQFDAPPLAGTVAVYNTTAAAAILAATTAVAYLKTAIVSPAPLAADSVITITPAGLTALTSIVVGMTVILPRNRS